MTPLQTRPPSMRLVAHLSMSGVQSNHTPTAKNLRRSPRTLFVLLTVVWAAVSGSGCASSSVAPSATPSPKEAPSALREPNAAVDNIRVSIEGLGANREVANDSVFNGFGCKGQNKSLALSWSPVPKAKSYAVIVHDPDAPTGVGFFHWVVVDIPAQVNSLALGASGTSMPAGAIEAYTDFGAHGYGGPCPPPGPAHRYEVTVYAVDTAQLGVPAGGTGALTRFMLGQHTVALGRATAVYHR